MKKNLGPICAMYPSLTTIVGAHVNGKPNFLAIAHVGIFNHGQPQFISFGINKNHFTNQGIHANKQFSVNIPSVDLMAETDYVGIVSGKTTDKSDLFDLFYGELKAAPLISACPVNIECRLNEAIDYTTHDIFVGEIMAVHAEEAVLKGGKLDVTAINPLLFDMASRGYFRLGQRAGDAWGAGLELKKKLRAG